MYKATINVRFEFPPYSDKKRSICISSCQLKTIPYIEHYKDTIVA